MCDAHQPQASRTPARLGLVDVPVFFPGRTALSSHVRRICQLSTRTDLGTITAHSHTRNPSLRQGVTQNPVGRSTSSNWCLRYAKSIRELVATPDWSRQVRSWVLRCHTSIVGCLRPISKASIREPIGSQVCNTRRTCCARITCVVRRKNCYRPVAAQHNMAARSAARIAFGVSQRTMP